MSSDSLQLMGMAERGLLPKVFGHKSSHGTPTFSILLSSAICATLAIFDFTSLVEMVSSARGRGWMGMKGLAANHPLRR